MRVRLWLLFGLCAGCNDLDAFRTGEDSVFRGKVAGSDSGDDAPSFIRRGFASHTSLELTFDPDRAAGFTAADLDAPTDARAPSPGTLYTYVCPADDERCRGKDRRPGHFDHAALEAFPNLAHDPLSLYDFPGGGRVRSYILGARFDDDADGMVAHRHAMVFVSLMDTDTIEVRILAPASVAQDGQVRDDALFGVFALEREAR